MQPLGSGEAVRLVLLMEPLAGRETQEKGTFLQDLFDSAPEAMVVTQDGLILQANREFVRMFEYPLAACIGADLDDLVVPDGLRHETEILHHNLGIEGRASIEDNAQDQQR